MSYIDRDLLPGEHLVYRTRLYWLVFLVPVLLSIVVLLPVAWLFFDSTWRNYAWVPAAFAAALIGSAILRRQSSDFAVTDRRVIMKLGILSTRSIELLLDKIEAITVNQSLIGRLFRYGDIIVSGSGGTKEVFHRIQSPFEFRRAVQSVTTAGIGLPAGSKSKVPQSESVYQLRRPVSREQIVRDRLRQ
ncbi:MAG: PH domain-containing protein [Betaproteobacteria bacterium]|nr:MAG: PH domain-containing protein [Betaproteobacteria bacterium]